MSPSKEPMRTANSPPDPFHQEDELVAALRRMWRGLLSRFVRHNPAYLVSAALMIAGVYSVIQPSKQTVGNLPAILATFSTFQVYELLLVAIAVFLVCRRRVMDDGATLVLIEVALLARVARERVSEVLRMGVQE